MRYSTEPWYTSRFNADLASAKHYETRRAKLIPILKEHLGQRKINRILDNGGDRGDLVVGLVKGAEPFVYNISGVNPAAGVTAISDPAACKPDLIINSNVLEHVGFPQILAKAILRAGPDGGLVFLEVPCEFATGGSRIIRRIAQIAIMAAYRPSLAQYLFQLAALYMMHEHINFPENCLTELLRHCGANVIAAGSYPMSARSGRADMAWCLSQKSEA